jgi:hypothetical protein
MTTILFNKLSIDNAGRLPIGWDTAFKIHTGIKTQLAEVTEKTGEQFLLITSPTDLSVVQGNAPIIYIDSKEYTAEELLSIIKNHEDSK